MKKILVEIKLATEDEANVELSAYKISEMITTGNFYKDSCLIKVTELPTEIEHCECKEPNSNPYISVTSGDCVCIKCLKFIKPRKKIEKLGDFGYGGYRDVIIDKINEIIEDLTKE